jgi:hypothetical protein
MIDDVCDLLKPSIKTKHLLLLRDAAQALAAAAQQLNGHKQGHRNHDHHGGNGCNGGVVFFADAGEHLPRQGVLLGAGNKQGNHDFIKGGNKGEKRSRDNARQDLG